MAAYLGINNNGIFLTSDNYKLLDSNDLSLYALSETSKLKININGIVYCVKVNLNTKE